MGAARIPAFPARSLRLALATVLIAAGMVTLPTPLPIGLALLAAGSALLILASRRARRVLFGIRRRYPGLSARLRQGTARLPARWRRVLERTDPWRTRGR